MKHVGIRELAVQLPALLDAVEKGERIVITRDGRVVATLVGTAETPERRGREPPSPDVVARRRQAMADLREIANRLKLPATHEEIKGWIGEGRR